MAQALGIIVPKSFLLLTLARALGRRTSSISTSGKIFFGTDSFFDFDRGADSAVSGLLPLGFLVLARFADFLTFESEVLEPAEVTGE